MVRIAICDDDLSELGRMVTLTEDYLAVRRADAELIGFSHPDGLLSAIEVERFHVYVLDIVMPMINGLDLGKEIRRLDREAQIVYATSEPQFALQAYSANPLSYLVKPVSKDQLFDVLDLAMAKSDVEKEQCIVVKTMDGLRVVNMTSIVCCEYKNHTAIFSIANGEVLVSRTFRENFLEYCAPLVGNRHFLQCHASFVVNMRRVQRFSKEGFMLSGGRSVPISPKRYPSVRDSYMDYLMEVGGELRSFR